WRGPRQDDSRIPVYHFYFVDNGPGAVSFSKAVFWDLFRFGKDKLISFSIHQKGLSSKNLVDLRSDDLAYQIFILLEEQIFFQILDPLDKGLPRHHHCPATKIHQFNPLINLFPDFKIRLYLTCFTETDLVVIPDVFRLVIYNLPDAYDLQIALIGIDDDIKVLIGFIFLTNHCPKHVFQDTDH